MQYVKFPMKTLRITQGYGLEVDGVSTAVSGGTYSHTGAYALDLGGEDTTASYLYAPCDVEVVRHYKGTGYNAVWYQTLEPVMCADGQKRELVFMLLHANDSTISELGIAVGKQFKQGEAFYKEGTGGGVATHCHLEVGLVPFSGTGWYQSNYIGDYNGANVWIINNKLIPSEIFYLANDTVVVEDMGYNWRQLPKSDYIEYTTSMRIRVLEGTGKNVEYFNSTDVNDVAGGNLPEGSEYVAVGYTNTLDDGFSYVKFIYSDGNEYWMAILSDRIEIYEYIAVANVTDLLGNAYFVKADGLEYYLNVYGNDTVADETNVTVYSKEDVKAQRWILKETSAGLKLFTSIDNVYALNMYTVNNNCSMYPAEGNDADSVIELIETDSKMIYQIRMVSHNLYLGIEGTATDGANVVWTDLDSSVAWKFIPEEELYPTKETTEHEILEEGIDVSDYQGVIDWSAVATDGVDFSIIKAVGSNSNGIYISNYWEDNYKGCKDNGIKVGAYLYTYAFNKTEADAELEYLFNALRGKSFEYPIFIDVEDNLLVQNCTVEEITNTVKYLCECIKNKGYYPAIYTYTNYANNYLNMDELTDYDLWIADYTGNVTYQGDYDMWQYTSSGSVNGISGLVDMNYSYKDYTNIINDGRLNIMADVKKYVSLDKLTKYDAKIKGLIDTKDAAVLASAKSFAEGLASNYDAAGSAATEAGKVQSNLDTEIARAKAEEERIVGLVSAAQGEVDALEEVVAGKASQTDLDTLSNKVGVVPEGSTVMGIISNIQENAYDDTELRGLISGLNTNKADKTQVATDIENAVKAEKEARETAVAGVQGAVDALAGTHATDKAALEGAIALKANITALEEVSAVANAAVKQSDYDTKVEALEAEDARIVGLVEAEAERAAGVEAGLDERLEKVEAFFVGAAEDEGEGENLKNALDTLVEIQNYIDTDGAAADEMVKDIAANAKAIEDHIATDHDFAGADATLKAELEGKINAKADSSVVEGIGGRVTTAEGKITTVEGKVSTLEGQMTTVQGAVATKVEQEAYNTKVAALEQADATLLGKIEVLEDKFGGAEGSVEDMIADAQQTAIDTAAGDATTKANKALEDAKKYADEEDAKIESRVDALETESAKHALKSEVEGVAGRVGTLETKVGTLETEMDAVEALAAANKAAHEANASAIALKASQVDLEAAVARIAKNEADIASFVEVSEEEINKLFQ